MAGKPSLRTARRLTQLFFLLLFLVLFRLTDYGGTDAVPYAVNLFFRWDPLAGISVVLSSKSLNALAFFLPAFIIVAVTILLGRVFCGWLCPMGTLLDLMARVLPSPAGRYGQVSHFKYLLLVLLLVSSAFSLQLVGFLDPFSLLVRGLTCSIDPGLMYAASLIFDGLYATMPEALSDHSDRLYALLRDSVLPYKQSYFYLATLSGTMLVLVFVLELLGRRFWCRNLCPLGALLALSARFSTYRRNPAQACRNCSQCAPECRMQAFGEDGAVRHQECILCMDCVDDCLSQPSRFRFMRPFAGAAVDLNRRDLLTAAAAGLTLPLLSHVDARAKIKPAWLLRPPGAVEEARFLHLCIRCGECMKVCIQNALQPCFLENGYPALFSPRLIPRLGYCEFNCTLCGQVCPTGAIRQLAMTEKHKAVIGVAYFDQNRCLPYADHTPCIVCEEHCPTHDKAIKFQETSVTDHQGKTLRLRRPYVIPELCIGCGICENKCPVAGKAAILVLTADTDEDGFSTLDG